MNPTIKNDFGSLKVKKMKRIIQTLNKRKLKY